jgi:septal ring factor EnvC (AmiA/AmiB activator)
MNENYDMIQNTASKFEDSYGNLMNAVDEAFQLSRQRLAEDEELKRLREERKQYDSQIHKLNEKIAEINRDFINALANETGRALIERDEARKESAMWKKSYEDLIKCL